MKKYTLILILVLVMVFSLCAIANESIKIGVHEPMTGPIAAGGQQTMEGVNLAYEQTSEVLGKKIEI